MYSDVEIDPIVPQLTAYPAWIEINPPLEDGLVLDITTGIIHGTPARMAKSKSVGYEITLVSSQLENATAYFTLVYVERSEYPNRGVIACVLDREGGFNMVSPALFLLSPFQSSFSVLQSLSWSDQYDATTRHHQNAMLQSTGHAFIRFVTYYESGFSSPTTFTLSSCSRVALYIDSYHTPFLESEPTTSIFTRRGTIRLGHGLHRLVVLLSTYSVWEGKSFFSLSYSIRPQSQPEVLLMSDTLVLPSVPPLFASAQTHLQQFVPLTTHIRSLQLATSAVVSLPQPAASLLDPASIRFHATDRSPVVFRYVASNMGGEAAVDAEAVVHEPQRGILASIRAVSHSTTQPSLDTAESACVQQMVVESFESFDARMIPTDIATSLLEFNTTLLVYEPGLFLLFPSVGAWLRRDA